MDGSIAVYGRYGPPVCAISYLRIRTRLGQGEEISKISLLGASSIDPHDRIDFLASRYRFLDSAFYQSFKITIHEKLVIALDAAGCDAFLHRPASRPPHHHPTFAAGTIRLWPKILSNQE